jgi:glycosyltransferase involved in cell wall biosynthesis
MKIALLSEKYTPDIGGLAISAGRLAKLLHAAGHSVRVFAPASSTALRASSNLSASEKRALVHEGISVTRFGVHKRVDDTLVDWFELLVAEHQREPFDILQAYFLPQAGFVAAFAGNYLGIPSVVSARGNDLERAVFDPARTAHIFYALQHASVVTTNTTEMFKKAQALVPGLEVTIIPNSVDTEHFRPLPKNEVLAETLGLGNLSVIGFVGELREKKGIRTLLDAYTQLNKKRPIILLVLGDVRPGEDKKIFDEYKKTNLDSRITVTGFISPVDLPQYYALMDVLVMPSLRDGLPNALLESMACEKAVIATSVGGIVDVIKDGENGRLVPVRDIEMLATTLHEMLTDEALRMRLGKTGRATVVNNFPLQKELEGNLALYQRLLKPSG